MCRPPTPGRRRSISCCRPSTALSSSRAITSSSRCCRNESRWLDVEFAATPAAYAGKPQPRGPGPLIRCRCLRNETRAGAEAPALPGSEVQRGADFRKATGHHRRRHQPGADRVVGLVVVQDGARVEQVVDVDADVGARAAEAQDLRQAQVDYIDPIA